MGLPLPIKLWDSDKLQILQRLDKYRQWQSLEEKRYCLVCGKLISGRQIEVIGGTRGTGPLRAVCPTKNCRSIPMDWILPTDEVLRETARPTETQNQVAAHIEMAPQERSIPGRARKWGMLFQAIGKIRERYGAYVGAGSMGLVSNCIGVFRICRSDSNPTGQLRIKSKKRRRVQ